MSRPPAFEFKQTPKGWLVHVPACLSDTGAFSRRYLKTRDEAQKFAARLRKAYKDDGEKASILPPRVADDAVAALKLLKGTELTLRDAAREVVAAMEILGDIGTIREAALAYRAKVDARLASQTLEKAVEIYTASLVNLRPTTLKSYEFTLQKLLAPLKNRNLTDITVPDIMALLEGRGYTSQATHIRNMRAFWNWSAMKPRQWAEEKALEGLESPRILNEKDIEILTPGEVKALLAAAEKEGTAAAAAYALAVFAGIRMDELARLTWGHINEESVELDKRVTKKTLRRNTPLCATLKAWLEATRGDAEDTDRIVPNNWVDVSKTVRRRAGWDVAARLASAEALAAPITRGRWKSNSPRHTCASVQVAIGTSLDDLIFKFGHSGGADLLRRHYVRRITKKNALEILSIGPNGTRIHVPEQNNHSNPAPSPPLVSQL